MELNTRKKFLNIADSLEELINLATEEIIDRSKIVEILRNNINKVEELEAEVDNKMEELEDTIEMLR